MINIYKKPTKLPLNQPLFCEPAVARNEAQTILKTVVAKTAGEMYRSGIEPRVRATERITKTGIVIRKDVIMPLNK
jgi:RNase P/RNase MRP subunit POP5